MHSLTVFCKVNTLELTLEIICLDTCCACTGQSVTIVDIQSTDVLSEALWSIKILREGICKQSFSCLSVLSSEWGFQHLANSLTLTLAVCLVWTHSLRSLSSWLSQKQTTTWGTMSHPLYKQLVGSLMFQMLEKKQEFSLLIFFSVI